VVSCQLPVNNFTSIRYWARLWHRNPVVQDEGRYFDVEFFAPRRREALSILKRNFPAFGLYHLAVKASRPKTDHRQLATGN
jgi:hypothetical protein